MKCWKKKNLRHKWKLKKRAVPVGPFFNSCVLRFNCLSHTNPPLFQTQRDAGKLAALTLSPLSPTSFAPCLLLTAVGDCLHWDRGLVMMRETFNLALPPASLSTLLPSCTAGPLLASRTKTHPFMRFPLDVIKTRPKSDAFDPRCLFSPRFTWFIWKEPKNSSVLPFCLRDWCTQETQLCLGETVHHKGTPGQAQTGYTNVIHFKFPRATAFTRALIARCAKKRNKIRQS